MPEGDPSQQPWNLKAKHAGRCRGCGSRVSKGDVILWAPGRGTVGCSRCDGSGRPAAAAPGRRYLADQEHHDGLGEYQGGYGDF